MKNRMKFLVEEQYATDNTNIGKVKITSLRFSIFLTNSAKKNSQLYNSEK